MAVALLLAAGSGERLGSLGPKAFVPLCGQQLIDWSLAALQASVSVERIVVALPEGVDSVQGADSVRGGATRSHSVKAALAAAPAEQQTILIHDAARPLVSSELIDRMLERFGAGECDCLIAAAPLYDTIKRADQAGRVVETLNRSELWAVQTPQIFKRSLLEQALAVDEQTLAAATDDAALIEQLGGRVEIFQSPRENLKVTTQFDLQLAESLMLRQV